MPDPADRAIDFLADLPLPVWLRYHAARLAHLGGYMEKFGRALSRPAGVTAEQIADWAALAPDLAGARYADALIEHAPSLSAWLDERRAAGIVHNVVLHEDPGPFLGIKRVPLAEIVEPLRAHRKEVSIFAGVDPYDARIEEHIEEAVSLGVRGLMCSPFMSMTPPSERPFDHIWDLAEAHGLPVWVHCSRHFWSASPATIGHPSYLAAVAKQRRDLVLIAGHAGYPWVDALVDSCKRLPNIHIDISTFSPRKLRDDPIFAPLLSAGAAELQDRVLFAGGSLGTNPARLLDELDHLGLPEAARVAWRYLNGARLLGLREHAVA